MLCTSGVGYMANTALGRNNNVRVVEAWSRTAAAHAGGGAATLKEADKLQPAWLFFVATRPIAPCEEILSPYNNEDSRAMRQ